MAGSSGPGASNDNSNKTSTSTTTSNTTQTLNQDRRIVADGGATAISIDGGTLTMTDNGAVNAAVDLGKTALTTNASNTALLISAADSLNKRGFDMMQAGQNWSSHIIDQANAQTTAALQAVTSVVSKPLDMQDPKNILVAVGVIAVAIVAAIAMRKAG